MRYGALILGSLLLLALPANAAQRTESKNQTIRLISTTVSSRVVLDRPPKGTPSKGDEIAQRSRLRNAVVQFDRSAGALVGSDVGVATFVSIEPPRATLKATATLPGGTIDVAGTIHPGAAQGTIAVVGGTGVFAGARGTVDVRNLTPSGAIARNVYRLRLP